MKTQLDYVYEHEKAFGGRTWLTQPMGGGQLRELTWAQALDEARRMAAYLRGLALPPRSSIAIFAKNNAWWLLSDLAIWMAGHVSVPIYPTLTAQSVRQILLHSESKLIFIGKLDGYAAMAPGIPEGLRRVVLPLGPTLDDAPRWDDLVKQTAPIADSPVRDPDELATIIYTSGSTGEPKGVMHSFRTMCAAFAFIELCDMKPEDRLISYLPLAHVAERAVLETTNFKVGYHVYFAESLDSFLDDVKRAQPTLFGSVPRLWLKFYSGVSAKLPPKKLATMLKIPILAGIVRKKVLDGLGLRHVRAAITGSAPTPPELIDWYGKLGLRLHDIYGMTENFAISHCVRLGEITPGRVGSPMAGVTCKISEAGEILVKSPGTMLGYYKADPLTKELIDAEGFIHTGDRGEVDGQQRLKITGRVKELFKTSKGKYVAPAPIENRLLAHPDVEQACVSGANMGQPFALVVLGEHHRKKGYGPAEKESLGKILDAHMESVNAALDPHEQLEKIIVAGEEWTVDNGLLTPTMKLKRSAIESRYESKVEAWYATRDRVVWD